MLSGQDFIHAIVGAGYFYAPLGQQAAVEIEQSWEFNTFVVTIHPRQENVSLRPTIDLVSHIVIF